MKRQAILKNVFLLLVVVGMLLSHLKILPLQFLVNTIGGVVGIICLTSVLFFNKERRRLGGKILMVCCLVFLFYIPLTKIISWKLEVPLEEMRWASIVFGVWFNISLLLAINGSSDIDKHTGNSKWIQISKPEYIRILLSSISFVTAVILSIYSRQEGISIVASGYMIIGIIAFKRV